MSRVCPCGKAVKSLSGRALKCCECRYADRHQERDLPGWKIEQQLVALKAKRLAERRSLCV